MYNLWRHITQSVLVVLLLVSGIWETYAAAKTEVKVGDTTTLSVTQQGSDTYIWELYDHAQGINFATTSGNCPETKARFVNGKNTGNSVQVEWLEAGEYFYKVISTTGCGNNMKIGHIEIKESDIPMPRVSVTYDCKRGVAILKAFDYQGSLRWNTGQTEEVIEITIGGEYSVVQIIDGRTSSPAKVSVADNIVPKSPISIMTSSVITRGEGTELLAEGCDNGTLHWFRDKDLTDEITDLFVSPAKTTSYYVVCKSQAGCVSAPTEVIVFVETSYDTCEKMYEKLAENQLVTPNQDGTNDIWNLSNLRHYCMVCNKVANVKLFNRWGAKVYEKSIEDINKKPFDGYSMNIWNFNGSEQLPDGVYFFIIEVNGKEKGISGYIQIVGSAEYPYTPQEKSQW